MWNLLRGVGDKAVGGWKKPAVREDGGATNMPHRHEVKADLPRPLPKFSILSSYDAIQLVGPGAAVCNSAERVLKESGTQEWKMQSKTDQWNKSENEINFFWGAHDTNIGRESLES